MPDYKLDAKEKLELTEISKTGKTYLITFNPYKNLGEQRTLYLVGPDGKTLKTVASAQTPPQLSKKIV